VCPPGEQAAARLGLRYHVCSSAGLSATAIRNLIFLEDYMGTCLVPPSTQAALLERVQASPGLSLATLLHERGLATADQVYALIAQNALYIDLAAVPLVEAEQVQIYRDQPTAEAQALLRAARLRTPSGPAGEPIASELLLSPGTRVWWDGQLWHLVNLGHTTVILRTDDGTLLDLARAYFLHQIEQGLITLPRPPTTDEWAYVHPEAQQRLRTAAPADLATANHRWMFVSAYLERRPLAADAPSPRTLRPRPRISVAMSGSYPTRPSGATASSARRKPSTISWTPLSRSTLRRPPGPRPGPSIGRTSTLAGSAAS
jgi:putative transposase